MIQVMPYGSGVLGVVVSAAMLVCASQLTAPPAVHESNEAIRQARARDADAVPDIPVLVDFPATGPDRSDGKTTTQARLQAPEQQRITHIFARYGTGLGLYSTGIGPDGVDKFFCKNGVVIASQSLRFGTKHIEAEEAEIIRGPNPKGDEANQHPDRDGLRVDQQHPMSVRFKGKVVVREELGKNSEHLERWTIRAAAVEYDYVADLLVATDAEMEISSTGLRAPIRITAARIKLFHPLETQPDGSLRPAERREVRLDRASDGKND